MLKSIQFNELKLPFTEKNFQYLASEKPITVPFSRQTEQHLLQALQNEKIYPHFAFLGSTGLGKKTILRKLILQFFKKEPVFDSFCSLSSWLGTYEEGRFHGGKFQEAKNNFLILNITNLSEKQTSLDFLISVLKEGKIQRFHLPETLYYSNVLSSLFPIPIDFRVILVGEEEDFEKITKKNFFTNEVFPMKILLDYECEANSKNLKIYSALLDDIFKKDESPLLDNSGKLRVLEEMLYQNESRNKFSTNLSDCKLIYNEASSLYKNKKKLFYKEIDLAIQNIKTRNSIQKQKYHDSIKRKIYNFPLTGKRLGRIYGLSIYTPYIALEEYGQVNVISARVGFGSGNFINVERESNMSGDLHDKGIFILQSYLKGLFPRTQNLGLDISILFEQSNSTIDGDSAIVAELLACLSALSGIEIPTQIAVTGAMSQYGEALAVGAVSQKIEAWYEFVSMFGKKKSKYFVYIPEANRENLIFPKKMLELMAKKNFFIKTYSHASDLIPEIFGISLGILESNGKYTRGSLLEKIEQEWDREKHKS